MLNAYEKTIHQIVDSPKNHRVEKLDISAMTNIPYNCFEKFIVFFTQMRVNDCTKKNMEFDKCK